MTIKEAVAYSRNYGLQNNITKYYENDCHEAVNAIEVALDEGCELVDVEKLIGRIETYRYDAIPKREIIKMVKEFINE